MKKFLWLFSRLRAMTLEEVLYRVRKMLNHKINKIKYSKSITVDNVNNIQFDFGKLYKNLNDILEEINYSNIQMDNSFRVFNEIIDLSNDFRWNKGMNGEWDKDISSYDIEFKNTDNIGDIRYTWEINRHQFMPYLATLYIKTNEKKYIYRLEKYFDDWIEENKFLKGVNWTSSMEIALRAYQWLIVLYILKDSDIILLKNKLCRAIIVSIEYVMNNLSLYSSANNHLIIEAAISSIIGYCFKDIYKQDWFDKGYEILREELKNQFHNDGVNKEQALHYQAFVTDMILQYNVILKKIGYEPIEEETIKKSVEFIKTLQANKIYMDLGDSDDAKILSFCPSKYNYYDYILTFASNYYKKRYTDNYNTYPEISLFYSDKVELDLFKEKEFSLYEDGGYFVINHNGNNLLFDFGELGFGSLAAHGHADALMVLFNKDYNEFFIDSGTYIYNIEKEKRDYYRSTQAHNTLCYNKMNQSEIKGPFLWGKKSNSKLVRCEENKESYIIEAINDGYSPNLHKRKIEYKKEYGSIIIYDSFNKEAEINYILDNNVKIEKVSENILKLTNNISIYVYLDGNFEIKNINISKRFLEEVVSKKISIKYSFEKEHLTLIADDLDKLQLLMEERGR